MTDGLTDFVLCEDATQYRIPTNGDTCATSSNVSTSFLSQCANGEEGATLLRDSVSATASKNIR